MRKISFFGLMFMTLVYYSCQKEDVVVNLSPDAGNSFLDIENEGYYVELTAQDASDGQKGIWRLYSGNNGKFENETDPRTKFFGEPGETYLLGWELSEGDEYKASTINVSFKPLTPVLISQPEEVIEGNVSSFLEAEPAKFGAIGKWELVEGEDAIIENADSCVAKFIGKEKQSYKVKWSLTYGSKISDVELEINTDTLVASAGVDNLDVTTFTPVEDDKYYNLDALLPAGGSGEWKIVDGKGGKVYQVNDPKSILKGMADSTYTLTWKVNVGEYESTDTLKVRFRGLYGVWIDKRDKQEYKFVRIENLEWMSENFNYAAPWSEYGRNWYYGQTDRANVTHGHPVSTPEDRKYYGRLYNYFGALDAAPEGWRLPTRAEFDKLKSQLGGPLYYWNRIIEGGDTGLDINFAGAMSYSNGNLDDRDSFYYQDERTMLMTSNFNPRDYTVIQATVIKKYKLFGLAGVPSFYAGATVRYVRDVVEN